MEPDALPQSPTHPGPRQTQSYLRNLMQQQGIHPKNKLGQNFLIDLNVLDLLVRSAELTRADLVLEVGSGTGSLTARLAAAAGSVVAVEVDAPFYSFAAELIGAQPHVNLIHADILKNKNQLNPGVLQALEEARQKYQPAALKLVANLPYAVATPVIANLLISSLPFERMVVTVQWEIAERLMAIPGTKDYGALAVLVQSLAHVELVRKLAPTVFWPRPQVHSAIVRINPDADKRRAVGDVQRLRNFLRDLYTHRRKNLRSALIGWPSGRREKRDVDARLVALGFDGGVRAEQLTVADHLRLCGAFSD